MKSMRLKKQLEMVHLE